MHMSDRGYTIGQAARAASVGVETIRFYERKGLVEQPPKPFQGARRYPQETVHRIRALRQGQELGFSLTEIDTLLSLRAHSTADCREVRARAQDHLADIERRRARLGEVADKLHELIAACPGEGPTRECAILDAFTSMEAGPVGDAPPESADSRVELRVKAIACGGCAARIRALLRDAPGVQDATVDQVTGVARVSIDATTISTESLAARLTAAGFPASAA